MIGLFGTVQLKCVDKLCDHIQRISTKQCFDVDFVSLSLVNLAVDVREERSTGLLEMRIDHFQSPAREHRQHKRSTVFPGLAFLTGEALLDVFGVEVVQVFVVKVVEFLDCDDLVLKKLTDSFSLWPLDM